jgi:hypothetical protein
MIDYQKCGAVFSPAEMLAMPQPPGVDSEALSIGLVQKSFELLGASRLTVDAHPDLSQPESQKAAQEFQRALLMAYNEGRRSMLDVHSLHSL